MAEPSRTEVATLAGGCFWCLEAVYENMKGVSKVESGYMGGKDPNPSYRDVCSGGTGHAEVVQVTFDPAVTSFADLLDVFFVIHDPTTLNRQGNDLGTQYRSAIFPQTPEQRETAERVKARVEASGKWKRPITTTIEPAGTWYSAEGYHQDYLKKNPGGYTCHWLRD
jgi:methionine-S-sulfoxide reductase